ncbi:hypothetical protein, partial [Arcanobacterium phocae]
MIDKLLTEPFLQFPTENSIRVVWFTEFAGTEHRVRYGEQLENLSIAATRKLSRTREDRDSAIDPVPETVIDRDI